MLDDVIKGLLNDFSRDSLLEIISILKDTLPGSRSKHVVEIVENLITRYYQHMINIKQEIRFSLPYDFEKLNAIKYEKQSFFENTYSTIITRSSDGYIDMYMLAYIRRVLYKEYRISLDDQVIDRCAKRPYITAFIVNKTMEYMQKHNTVLLKSIMLNK